MLRRTLAIVVVLGAAVASLGLVFLLGIRAKSPAVRGGVRRFNRRYVNPRQLRTAGQPGAYASVIRHLGRSSGRSYQTPVGAFRTDDGFVVSLPYGSDTDWLRNVMAAGGASLVHEGVTYDVDRPELVPVADVARFLPAGEIRTLRLFAVDTCLQLHASEDTKESA